VPSATLVGVALDDSARVRSGRMGELDAVRGIAAFVVVLHHCWQTLLPDQNTFPFLGAPLSAGSESARWAAWINVSPLKLLFSGHAAVGVFFVLSGMVLTRQLTAQRNRTAYSYRQFVIQRVFRIWVPFALVILMAAGLCAEAGGPLPQLPWINESWNQPVTWQLVAGHLLMLGASAYVTLDNPMWSLVHEMRISLIFPVLTRVASLSLPRLVAGAAVLFTLLSISHVTGPLIAWVPGTLSREVLHSLLDTTRYGLFFVLGIALALKGGALQSWLQKRQQALRGALWVLAFALLAVPFLAGYLELAYALGATLLLALCTASVTARRLLGFRWLTWLGKVSYSLYLVHLLVLLTLVHVLRQLLPLQLILPLAVASSLVFAELCNRFIELPANRLGKRLAGQAHSA